MTEPRDNSLYALDRLGAMLRSGRFAQGAKLPPERQLAEEIGVSRNAVRRALDVLETEGVVWRRQGSGTYTGAPPVQPDEDMRLILSGADPFEVMEVRLRLEPQLAQLAALRAAPADIEAMYGLITKLSEPKDADGTELWDSALHRKIAISAGNSLFLALFDLMNRVRQDTAWKRAREQARNRNRTRQLTLDQHLAIVDAIAQRDPLAAAEAMRTHLLALQDSLIRSTSLDHMLEISLSPAAT